MPVGIAPAASNRGWPPIGRLRLSNGPTVYFAAALKTSCTPATASLPLTVLGVAALMLGFRLQTRMSPAVYAKILRATLVAFVVLLIGQATIELAHRMMQPRGGSVAIA